MKKRLNTKRYFGFILLVLMAAVLLSYSFMDPVSSQARAVYQTMAGEVQDHQIFYQVKPRGDVIGGVLIYPDDQEDPISYAPLARQLSERGLEVRVVKYPMARASLFKADPDRLLGEGSPLAWITLGLGTGSAKACSLADKSDVVAGVILVGSCSGEVNLNDNDLQIALYQLAEEPMEAELFARVREKLPSDTIYNVVTSREEIFGKLLAGGIQTLSEKDSELETQIQRILAAKTINPKNRK